MFSIITPSYQQLEWLRLCAASVADQEGVTVEHIVQDAGSGPELETWAGLQPGLHLYVEKDSGMYDAINRGLRKAKGQFCAYLNCDEQYLPGALRGVQQLFDTHPELDVLFGDAHVVHADGSYLCTRHALIPARYHSLISNNLAILTCATFFRRRLLEDNTLFFDPAWRNVGDAVWVGQLLRRRVRMGLCRFATSIFTDTGKNMNLNAEGSAERKRLAEQAPGWIRMARPAVVWRHRLRRLFHGHYRARPVSYEIYTAVSPKARSCFRVARSTSLWRGRL